MQHLKAQEEPMQFILKSCNLDSVLLIIFSHFFLLVIRKNIHKNVDVHYNVLVASSLF